MCCSQCLLTTFDVHNLPLDHIFAQKYTNGYINKEKKEDMEDERCSALNSVFPSSLSHFLSLYQSSPANPIDLYYQLNISLISQLSHNPPDLLLCSVWIWLIHAHSFQRVVLLFSFWRDHPIILSLCPKKKHKHKEDIKGRISVSMHLLLPLHVLIQLNELAWGHNISLFWWDSFCYHLYEPLCTYQLTAPKPSFVSLLHSALNMTHVLSRLLDPCHRKE